MDKKLNYTMIILALIIAAAGIFYFIHLKNKTTYPITGEQVSVSGSVADISTTTQSVIIEDGNGNTVFLLVSPDTKIYDENGSSTDLGYFKKGFFVEAGGMFEDSNRLDASQIKVAKTPNIIVYAPSPNDEVGEILSVTGIARVFENQFSIRIYKGNDVIYETGILYSSPDAGIYGDFSKTIFLTAPLSDGDELTLDAFDFSPKDGSIVDEFKAPLKFKKEGLISKYVNSAFGVSFYYPSAWRQDYTFGNIDGIPNGFSGNVGFFKVSGINSALSLDDLSQNIALQKQQYGASSTVFISPMKGLDGRFIIPSSDQPENMNGQAAFVAKYPKPVNVKGNIYNYFILYADKNNIQPIAETLKF